MVELTRDQILQKAKKSEKIERLDLRGIDLSKTQLPGASLARSDLEGANLESSNLQKANLKSCGLREAYLVGTDLRGANLENADLEGAMLDRANLAGANLARANIESASLVGANLSGARLAFAQLASANLAGADLTQAIFTHADLDEASLTGVRASKANFANASLRAAGLEDGDFTGAGFQDARMSEARAGGARFTEGSFLKADLTGAILSKADLSMVDARQANFKGAILLGACLTGAKIAGMTGTGTGLTDVVVAWVDTSPGGDGGARISNGEIPALISGLGRVRPPAGASGRYFGRGDVVRDAVLTFDSGAKVEIDSVFQNCSITLGAGTELVIGKDGVLSDCRIEGAGHITVHGKFFERDTPGIVGAERLVVSSEGVVVASVAQATNLTHFAFEKRLQASHQGTQGRPWQRNQATREQGMSDGKRAPESGKKTLIEEGAEFKGTLSAKGPIVVMGRVEGEVTGPAVEVTETGSLSGKVKVGELNARGELAGSVEADAARVSGRVRDQTTIRAKALEVRLSAEQGKLEVTFGECELVVGDVPTKEAALSEALARPKDTAAASPAPLPVAEASNVQNGSPATHSTP